MTVSPSSSPRVVFLSPFSMGAASARRIYEISRGIAPEQAVAVFPKSDHYGTTDREDVVRVDADRGNYLAYLRELLRYLRAVSPEIIVFGKASPYSFVPALLYRTVRRGKLVFDCDEWDPATVADADAPLLKTLAYRTLTACAARMADAILVSNENILDKLPEQVHSRCTYTPNGVNWEQFGKTVESSSPDKFTLTYVGSLHKDEQIRPVLNALPYIKDELATVDRFEDFRIRFVGPGDLDALRAHVQSKYVEFPGPVPHKEVPEQLARSNVLLALFGDMVSLRYASNMKLFEYMATGRPIVASDVGEVRRILGNGQAGYLVDPSNPREIASTIAKIARSPEEAEKKGQRARKRARDHYRWELLARRVRTVVENLLGDSGF